MSEGPSSPTRMTASPGRLSPLETRVSTCAATSFRERAAIAVAVENLCGHGLMCQSSEGNSREILHCALRTSCASSWFDAKNTGEYHAAAPLRRAIIELPIVGFDRGIAQSGSAPALGAGCREFESLYPDQSTPLGCGHERP